jgi:hypothetical protein
VTRGVALPNGVEVHRTVRVGEVTDERAAEAAVPKHLRST